MGSLVLAVDIGGTTIKAAVLDADHRPVVESVGVTPRGDDLVPAVAALGAELLDQVQRADVAAAGVAIPGLIDTARGVSLEAVNLRLRDTPVAAPLAESWGVPTRLAHDVRCAAEAERRLSGRALASPFVVVIGTGIAAVGYVDGKPILGHAGQAGELGHVVVRPDGPECGCGKRGCLESVASAGAIARDYARRSGRASAGARDVADRLATDPVAAQVWDDAVQALADGLLMATALLDPQVVVLGGGLAEAGAALVDPVVAAMSERAGVLGHPSVVTAVHGSRAGMIGAGLAARDLLAAPTAATIGGAR